MIENNFSWSKSRDEEFRECQRKYFYNRYASWGGWDKDAPKEARMAYVLKNLKNRWAWKGETVHHLIEEVLKSLKNGREGISEEAALLRLTQIMRQDYKSSKAKKNWENPKNNLGLFEHEYEKEVTDAVWKEIHDTSAQCLKNFYTSSFFKELTEDDKKSWLVIEDLEEFEFEGAKIFVKLDFARKKNGKIEIYDWKTGKDDGVAAAVQIGAYVIYAMRKWKVPASDIRAFLFNLTNPSPKASEQAVNDALIEETSATILASIRQMRELLSDPVKNVPKPRENFSFTENTRLCNYCNFYKICEKWAGNPN
ncbi:MAG: hypothetical protein AUJ72_04140 [Candidatus Omnitrophica bacterium CG1_02_46_14]|nr:MAG: hypothetical protein AUJ72_04140 [Candidatus Omnitrophica bacterium CG1_02_46_14]